MNSLRWLGPSLPIRALGVCRQSQSARRRAMEQHPHNSFPDIRPAVLAAAAIVLGSTVCASAQTKEPIKIGVIGEESAVAGASLTKAAEMAADDINAQGGVDGRKIQVITYDDHSSATDGVRAFQRAVNQDKVQAVI